MLKKIIDKLSNPILFYSDKSGNAIFRNFCLIHNTGMLFRVNLQRPEVGKFLEYRIDLNKKLRKIYILISVILYLFFIHFRLSLITVLTFEFLWIVLAFAAKTYVSYSYYELLTKNLGEFETVEFNPPLSLSKKKEHRMNFYSKCVIIALIVGLFFIPSFLLEGIMKLNLNAKRPRIKSAIAISKIYLTFYPKKSSIYDMSAYAKFKKHDFVSALNDYKTVLEMSGKRFDKKDYARFANMLYIQKQISTPEDAVVLFDDYLTRKKLSVLEQSQMIWIKSIFSVENNMPETILQDYDDLIASLPEKDESDKLYILSDKAYVAYLMEDYVTALEMYNIVISNAVSNPKFQKNLQSLYAERGYTKQRLGDMLGADEDFKRSGIDIYYEIDKYEPKYENQEFIKDF